MFIDGRQVPDGTIIETDIAIIGAGAAGITLAREFIGSQRHVTLIESGGLEPDEATQALYAGESKGVDYPLEAARLRYFGGSTNHWGGFCRPLAPIDFEARSWVPHSGWPITRATLDPFYARATTICQLGAGLTAGDFDDSAAWRLRAGGKSLNWQSIDLPGDDFVTRFFIYSKPTHFGEAYGGEIGRATNITTYLNSNVTEIVPDAAVQRVERLTVATLGVEGHPGRRFEIRPRMTILACGGIENARLLLLSNSVATEGLGNGRDLVGRFFMEHVHVPGQIALIALDARARIATGYDEPQVVGDAEVRAILMPSDAYLRREQRLGLNIAIYPQRPVAEGSDAERPVEAGVLGLLRLPGAPDATVAGEATLFGASCAAEPIPSPDNRVTLSTDRDALGLPRTRLDWRPLPVEQRDLARNVDALARNFGAWGHGIVRALFTERPDWQDEDIGWGNHHMGTTRMAADPQAGVVDADCRVHGIDNLYVAGSSIFPTGGPVNPTFTIVALAMRLADHLKSRKLAG
nr:GMC family oxidoreductase [uncultured Dongia sp.]